MFRVNISDWKLSYIEFLYSGRRSTYPKLHTSALNLLVMFQLKSLKIDPDAAKICENK